MSQQLINRLAAVFGLLVVATLFAAFLNQPVRRPLLAPESLPASATRIEIEGPLGRVELKREKEAWVASAPAGYPADAKALQELLEKLPKSTLSEPVTEDAQRYPMFGLSASSATLVKVDAGSARALEFHVGSDGPDYPSAFIRLAKRTEVVQADGFSSADWSKAPGDWLDKHIASGMAESVISVAVKGPKGTWELKQSTHGWKVGGRLVAPSAVDSLVRQARQAAGDLEAESVLDAAAAPRDMGLGKPELRVSATTKTGPVAFTVGKKDPEGRRYVQKAGEPRVIFLVGDWKLDALRKSAADFLKAN
ncbi:MAG: DUF4340 domain-containing protein [Elusimicrobia bacterium]|nr:DUF4340 domain-containing protein [Elusimicrobiota bacterium]